MDTPLAESGIVGTAVGAAVVGLRPVCEMQFADFVSCGFDQLVNVAGKMHYRQGLPVTITVRLPERRRLLGRPVPLAEPRGVVHARARAEGRRAVARRRRQGPAHRGRSATPTRSSSSSTSTSTAGSRARSPTGRTRRRSPRASRARAPTSWSSPTARWSTRRWRRPRTSTAPRSRSSTCARSCRSTRRRSSRRCASARRWSSSTRPTARAPPAPQVAALIAEQGFEDLDGPVVRRRDARRADPVLAAARAGGAAQRRPRDGRRAVSSSPTETHSSTSRCPRWACPSPRARSSSGTSSVGDWVEADETICEVTTDKIDTEVPSPAAGRLAEVLVEVGETVDVGTVLARIATDATPRRGARGRARRDRRRAADRRSRRATATATAATRRSSSASPPSTASTSTQVQGTGRDGRVRKQDVLALVERRRRASRDAGAAAAHRVALPARAPSAAAGGRHRRQPLSRMRRAIGEHMKRSLDTAATCTTLDRGRHDARRARAGAARPDGAAARRPRASSRRCASTRAERLARGRPPHRARRDVHLGIAVSLGDDGLIVPVIARRAGPQRRGARAAHPDARQAGPGARAGARRGARRHVHDHEPRAVRRRSWPRRSSTSRRSRSSTSRRSSSARSS